MSPTRCPYCHDDVRPTGSVACLVCLGRHHASCWRENDACASCGATQSMRAAPRRIDDASVRGILLRHNFTDQEIDAYQRGDKSERCCYAGCLEQGVRDCWGGKGCKRHFRGELLGSLATLALVAFVLMLLL